MFMDYAGSAFSLSVKSSLMSGELVVTEVDENILPKFDTKEADDDCIARLKFWEKTLHEDAKDGFRKFSWDIRRDLSLVHGTFHSTCHASLRNRLEVDA